MHRKLPLVLVALGVASLALAQEKKPAKKPGFIGIVMEGVALEGSPARGAVRVQSLFPGSPAEAAGVRPGDVITALDGRAFVGVPPEKMIETFRGKILERSPGDAVRLSLIREATTVSTRVGDAPAEAHTGSGPGWSEGVPDWKRLLEEHPGKVVTVSADRARWERELTVTLIERPGTRSTPLPANGTLWPALEALPLAPEAGVAASLIEAASVTSELSDLRRRLDEDELVDDAFRLPAVRYLKRDPLRLPTATRLLGRSLSVDFEKCARAAATWLAADLAPIFTSQSPAMPPEHASPKQHVDFALSLMRRSRSLVERAFARLSADEKELLARDLPVLAERFKESIYLHDDEDTARVKRHWQAVDLLSRVDRSALAQALLELAPLSSPIWLDRLTTDLKEAEARDRGHFSEYYIGANGWLLLEETSDLGPVSVGGSGPNGYRGDAALIIDLGGDDHYYRNAGGARPGLPVAVCIDLAGNDRYQATEPFSQGAALMGAGLLVDRAGDDTYASMSGFSQGASLAGAAALVDSSGNDVYKGESYAQGAALAVGIALLLDGGGDDSVDAGLYAQGFAGPLGFGALVAHGGDDRYVCSGRKKCSYGEDGVFDAHGQGSSCGFRGKASGGIGVLADDGGNDFYNAGNFSQGCGYYFGWGALCDMKSGNDVYEGSRYAQGAAAHSAVGSFWDEGGNDRYSAWIGAAQSLAWDLAVTAIMDDGGDDLWDGGYNLSQGASAHNGFSLFYDGGGRDTHRIHRKLPAFAGPNDYHGGSSVSVYIDAGGPENVYDVASGVAFVPSRGATVWGEKSIFLDADAPIDKIDVAKFLPRR